MASVDKGAAIVAKATFQGHTEWVNGVVCSADGSLIVSGSIDGTVRVWSTEQGTELRQLTGHVGIVGAVTMYRPDDADEVKEVIVSGAEDGKIKLWDATSGDLLSTLEAGAFVNRLLVWRGEQGFMLAAGFEDIGTSDLNCHLRVWVLGARGSGGRLLHTFAHEDTVTGLAVSGDTLISSSYDGSIKMWSMSQGKLVKTLSEDNDEYQDVAVVGNRVIGVCFNNTWRVWDMDSGQQQLTVKVPEEEKHEFRTLSVYGDRLLFGTSTGSLLLYDLQGCRRLCLDNTHKMAVIKSTLHSDMLVTSGRDCLVKSWQVFRYTVGDFVEAMQSFKALPPEIQRLVIDYLVYISSE